MQTRNYDDALPVKQAARLELRDVSIVRIQQLPGDVSSRQNVADRHNVRMSEIDQNKSAHVI